jgi:predicted MFS family arabinose efflux permease
MATPRFRWEWLAGLFLMRFSAGLFFQWVAGAAEALRRELELDFAAIGALVGAFSLSGVAVTLLAGMVAQRFGDRRVLIGCFAVMAAGGAATVTADGFAGLFAGRFVAGIGGVAALTLLVKVTADHFAGPHLSTALATVMTSWPGGIAVGTVAWAWIADLHGWRAAAAGATGVILLALVAGLRILPPDVGGAVTRRLSWPTRTEAVLIAWAALAWAGFNGAMAV